MNTGRSIFAQLVDIAPFNHFEYLADKHQANRWTRDFTAWSHFICMAYAQLHSQISLRNLLHLAKVNMFEKIPLAQMVANALNDDQRRSRAIKSSWFKIRRNCFDNSPKFTGQ